MEDRQESSAGDRAALVWVLLDGLGDLSVEDFDGRTPLAAAFTPFLDCVARAGYNGLCDPVEPGLACGSDTAHLSLFGYDPREYYRGRGAFESLGAGLEMKAGEIAFKCNFATLDEETGVVTHRRCDRNFEREGPILCGHLDKTTLPSFPQHRVRVKYATEHRCGLVIEGPGLCDRITSTDPLKDNLRLLTPEPLDETEEAAHTARVVAEASSTIRDLLKAHEINAERARNGKNPANCVLLRGCGERLEVETFERRHGFRACMVAPTKVIAGIGASLGMAIVPAAGATGDYHSLLSSKVHAIAEALGNSNSNFQVGFLHVKSVDDAGHDGNAALKRDLIEAADAMVGQLLRRLWEAEQREGKRYFVCCTGDHTTPAVVTDHSHEPVPFAIAGVSSVVSLVGEEALASAAPREAIKLPYAVTDEYRRTCEAMLRGAEGAVGGSGDAVCCFSEVAAAEGSLGRFPGSEVIPLIKSFL